MIANLAVLFCALSGFIALSVAMERHAKQLLHRSLTPRTRLFIRIAGWLLLAVALLQSISSWSYDIGIVAWLGWLTVAGMALIFTLPRVSTSESEQRESMRKVSRGEAINQAVAHVGLLRPIASMAALLAPLALFAWQLTAAPTKPTLRDDALHDTIGPWSFVIAEQDREPPVIEAMDVPLKQFVLRFCDGCDAQIKMAYLKVRKPRSTRAVGNGLFGRQGERKVEIPIPASAELDDGIWLTVESRDGQFYEMYFSIERLSPATARFIRERS